MINNPTNVTLPNNIELLELYKQEKSVMDLPSDPFPSFREWKSEYMIEFIDSHADSKMVDVETAVAETEKELKSDELAITPKVNPQPAPITPKPKVKPSPKPTPKKSESKKDLAIALYKSMMVKGQHPSRKDVIDRFVKDINMSPAGASTYHHSIKQMF